MSDAEKAELRGKPAEEVIALQRQRTKEAIVAAKAHVGNVIAGDPGKLAAALDQAGRGDVAGKIRREAPVEAMRASEGYKLSQQHAAEEYDRIQTEAKKKEHDDKQKATAAKHSLDDQIEMLYNLAKEESHEINKERHDAGIAKKHQATVIDTDHSRVANSLLGREGGGGVGDQLSEAMLRKLAGGKTDRQIVDDLAGQLVAKLKDLPGLKDMKYDDRYDVAEKAVKTVLVRQRDNLGAKMGQGAGVADAAVGVADDRQDAAGAKESKGFASKLREQSKLDKARRVNAYAMQILDAFPITNEQAYAVSRHMLALVDEGATEEAAFEKAWAEVSAKIAAPVVKGVRAKGHAGGGGGMHSVPAVGPEGPARGGPAQGGQGGVNPVPALVGVQATQATMVNVQSKQQGRIEAIEARADILERASRGILVRAARSPLARPR